MYSVSDLGNCVTVPGADDDAEADPDGLWLLLGVLPLEQALTTARASTPTAAVP
ncbi:MAG TPA: hypothetical protein VF838_04885 [Trebonia sp.]